MTVVQVLHWAGQQGSTSDTEKCH